MEKPFAIGLVENRISCKGCVGTEIGDGHDGVSLLFASNHHLDISVRPKNVQHERDPWKIFHHEMKVCVSPELVDYKHLRHTSTTNHGSQDMTNIQSLGASRPLARAGRGTP